MILEQRCSYTGLALWATPKLTKSEIRFLGRLARVGYDTVVSDDPEDLRLHFLMYMAKCSPNRVDERQLEIVEDLSHITVNRTTCSETPDREMVGILLRRVKREYPHALVIPGLGDDGMPALTIIAPNTTHNGLAMWIGETGTSREFGPHMLSGKQFSYLEMMADRSYLVAVTNDLRNSHCYISGYFGAYYVGCSECPPRYCASDCPRVNISKYPLLGN